MYWLKKSDEQCHPLSPYLLAWMNEKGYMAEGNLEQKFELLEKSAERGCALAQYQLGRIYYEGKEIDKKIV